MVAELCKCGHPLAAHTGTSVSGVPCKVCGVTDRGLATGLLTEKCMGWDPPTRGGDAVAEVPAVRAEPALQCQRLTAPAGATTPPEPPAGPSNLTYAIQAAAAALKAWSPTSAVDRPGQAVEVILEAAWPLLARALRVAHTQIDQLRDRIRQEPCGACYERCCGSGDQCRCHMWPWDDNPGVALDQAAPEPPP
jgi:hypothetical protein